MSNIQQPRRRFLLTGLAGFCTALFANMPKISFAKSYETIDKDLSSVKMREYIL
jgi:hypothetical protein